MRLKNFFKIGSGNTSNSRLKSRRSRRGVHCAAKPELSEKMSIFAERKHASKSEIPEWALKLVDHEYAIVIEADRCIAEAQRAIRFDRSDSNVTMDTFLCMKTMRGFVAKRTNALNRIEDLQKLLVEMDSNKDDADYDMLLEENRKAPQSLKTPVSRAA
jgi:hypothetical protein